MNLKDMVMSAEQGGGMGTPPPNPMAMGAKPPMPAGAGAVNPQVKGLLDKLAHANGGEGIQEVAKTIFAILGRILEFAVPLYGSTSEEGKTLNRIIKDMNKLSGNKQTSGSMASMIQSLISILPTDMQKIDPSNLTDLLTKGGAGGMGAGAKPPLPNPATSGLMPPPTM